MDEYSYTILYKKETIIENQSYFFSPCYFIKGMYDEEAHLFLDELNKERFHYSDINIIGGDSAYCIGDVYTEEELFEKFPDAYGLEEALIFLFKEAESYATIGSYDKDSTSIKISNQRIQGENFSEDFILDEESHSSYERMREQFGCDVILFLPNHIDSILSMEDMSEIKRLVKERLAKRNDYQAELTQVEHIEQAVFINMETLDPLLAIDDINVLKEEFQAVVASIYQADLENEVIERTITLDGILGMEEELHQCVMESTDIEYLRENLNDLYGFYQDLLDTMDAYQEEGHSFVKTHTYFSSQIEFLKELMKEEDFEAVRTNYAKFHQETRKHLNSMEEEWQKEEKKEFLETINEKIDETNKKLSSLVGLENVKTKLEEMFAAILFQKKTEENLDFEIGSKHMAFLGNPGTGKTTVANIIAPLLYQLGYLKSDKVAFVSSKDLIGKYAGHTEPKTDRVIQKNLGGLIVFDEAYNLTNEGQKFGQDAINVILKEMEKNRTMFIFCGYKKAMESFIKMNEGLESRIGAFLDFFDYNEEELFEIFKHKMDKVNAKESKKHSLTITDEALEKVYFILKEAKKVENFGNGRFVDKLFDTIYKKHAKNTRDVSAIEALYTITQEDIPDSIFDEILFNGGRKNTPYSSTEMGFQSEKETLGKTYTKSYTSPNTGSK